MPGSKLAPEPPLSWHDAWIFASLSRTTPTPLADLIANADRLNHAIPTALEIRHAFAQLYARGLISVRGEGVSLTDVGRMVYDQGAARRGGLFAYVDNLHHALTSPACPAPQLRRERLASTRFGFVSELSVQTAYATYQQRLGG